MDIHIDFETRSFADIRTVGSYRYSEDPTTELLCLAWGVEDTPPRLWVPAYLMPPKELLQLIEAGAKLHAWNAEFEMDIWENICVKRHGWPAVPLAQWSDTMARAATRSLPLSLEKCAAVIGDVRKDSRGKKLITKLCKPYRGHFREYEDFQQDFLDLYDYCKQDVVTERHVFKKLKPLSPKERRVWEQTIRLNRRGIPIDKSEVMAVLDKVEKQKERLNAKLPWLTSGEVISASQVEKLAKWCSREYGKNIESLNKLSVDTLLSDSNLTTRLRSVLNIRKEVSRSSTAKLSKAVDRLCSDGTIKNNLVYHGANTGRYAGRGFQLQNLPRGVKLDDPDTIINDFMVMEPAVLNLTYDVMDMASNLIRSLIKVPPGKKLLVGDFTSIEAWVTPWIAAENAVLQVIESGLDLYSEIASRMFGVNYKNVTAEQRQAGKICVLAAGFSGGAKALLGMAEVYKMSMHHDEAEKYIVAFRRSRPELTMCWRNFDRSAKQALNMGAPVVPIPDLGCNIFFRKEGSDLLMKLPSGRDICYPNARIEMSRAPWGDMTESVVYDTVVGSKWDSRIMSGGNFFQNAVQGTARDLLVDAQLNLEAAGYPVIISVHDEAGALVEDDSKYSLEEFLSIMVRKPGWASNLPVKAAGYEGYRYKK
jgi:DNA polymerase